MTSAPASAQTQDRRRLRLRQWHEIGNGYVPLADVRIVTSEGKSIAAHSGILASASPVLERLLEQSRKTASSIRIVLVLGVPSEAVFAFVRFLYSSGIVISSREVDVEMAKHGLMLLALAHAYRIKWLKRVCESGVTARLSAENVVDALKMAKLCDSPKLYLRCMRLVAKDLAGVQASEGWSFLQKHDPALEQEILRFLHEDEQQRNRWKRERAEQNVYQELSDAMSCLQRMFGPDVGCRELAAAPHGGVRRIKGPCDQGGASRTCDGLLHLIGHFSTCNKKLQTPQGCTHCKKLLQLFRLHSSLCDHVDTCKVPLCKQFRYKIQEEKVDRTWRLLVKKVAVAGAMSSLANRRRPEQVQVVKSSWLRYKGHSKIVPF